MYKSILIVDDQKERLELLNDIFGEDYRLCYANNGKKAMEIFSQHSPSLVITDLNMPNLDGIDLIRNIRACDNTPIIAISGDLHTRLNEAQSVGANIVMTIPFKVSVIIEHARALLDDSL